MTGGESCDCEVTSTLNANSRMSVESFGLYGWAVFGVRSFTSKKRKRAAGDCREGDQAEAGPLKAKLSPVKAGNRRALLGATDCNDIGGGLRV